MEETLRRWKWSMIHLSTAKHEVCIFQWPIMKFNLTIKQEKSYTNPVPSPSSLCRTQSGRIKKEKMHATTNGGLANPYFIPGIVSSDSRCQMPQTDRDVIIAFGPYASGLLDCYCCDEAWRRYDIEMAVMFK